MTDPHSFLWLGGDGRHRERIDRFGEFTVAFDQATVRTGPQVALLSFDAEHIDALSVVTRAAKLTSFQTTYRFTRAVLCEPIPIDDLAEHLDRYAAKAVRDGGQLNARTTQRVRQAISEHYPDAAKLWSNIERHGVGPGPDLWPEDREPILAYERDAVGLALEAAGFDRRQVLASWDGDDAEPFLKGIAEYRVYEDPAIAKDTTVFGDWQFTGVSELGFARFIRNGRRLTIINANRLPTEHTLGCDLLYYSMSYNAYVLVQYKRLRKERDGWVFRPDDKFDDELGRMRDIAAPGEDSGDPDEHRFGENFSFVKFCQPTITTPFSGEMAAGYYLPLDYLDKLTTSGRFAGRLGGVVIDRAAAGRHLVNTTMIPLVADAWVGTRGLATAAVQKVIQRSLAAENSLIVAVDEPLDANAA